MRAGRILLLVSLPSGIIEMDNGVSASAVRRDAIDLAISWPPVMRDPMAMMNAILSFCTDLNVIDGTLLSQGLMDYLEDFQYYDGSTSLTLPNQVAVRRQTGFFGRHNYFRGEHCCYLLSAIFCAEQPLFYA